MFDNTYTLGPSGPSVYVDQQKVEVDLFAEEGDSDHQVDEEPCAEDVPVREG